MTANQTFQYHGNPISFHKGDNLMVNATQMAKPFNKSPKDFLKTEQSKRFIEALSEVKKILSSDLVKVTYGNNGGTWMPEGTTQSQFEQRISRLEEMMQTFVSRRKGNIIPSSMTSDQETAIKPRPIIKDIPCLTTSEIRMHHRDAMLVRQIARLISREHGIVVRSARVFEFLRREGWLLSAPECYNAPSEESAKRGLILAAHSSATGSGVKYYTPYITREGYDFFSRIIIQKGGHI